MIKGLKIFIFSDDLLIFRAVWTHFRMQAQPPHVNRSIWVYPV